MTEAHAKPEWAQSRLEKENARRIAEGKKPRRKIWRWIVLGVIIVGALAYFLLQPPAPEPAEDISNLSPVARQLLPTEIAEIRPTTLAHSVKVTGTLVPGRQSSVASMASGRVLEVTVRPGDSVSAGDVLAEIDRATLTLQLNQQRATAEATRIQLLSTRQQLERTEELARQGLATPSALDQARASAAALESNLAALDSGVESAKIALDNATVRSPLDGVVSARSVEPGQTINAGTPLFTIVNLEEMEFEASASVNSSALVSSGQKATISVTGIDGTTFDGDVTRVNPVAIAGTRAVPIYISIDNRQRLLRGGMFATGFIVVAEKHDAIAVPASALREDAEGDFVLVLDRDNLVRKAVTPGEQWDRGRTVEIEGLSPGDRVIIAPLPELSAGDAYQVVGS
ncbi:efflux RND transporter periplasmic adaptor subunit [Devosia faecipullorum]|uniref:efflux RND transporter periplasmic adaptor subunit n=1 Tax=Devosia faecipullorum TaxID=2755039 RepID=UPI00187B8A85|nr:efflux RND transporter periplasmic adaptor subunit [Devosia faecipullorum]MBE7734089.1 efflux RND transporter periplasmic adaptor subunit [Devosia faecipullorum]